ncbi:hypothetical protein FGO68_gene7067 [Halteria grandinella]|uniref:Uncharacterized protein n=1 Tax=Halteria grandinella TaxID=5974 RepID=A0A8J8SUC8_HALGN|nr:hypothetical protein FGO68_gene7067 [Halteria grandinella]
MRSSFRVARVTSGGDGKGRPSCSRAMKKMLRVISRAIWTLFTSLKSIIMAIVIIQRQNIIIFQYSPTVVVRFNPSIKSSYYDVNASSSSKPLAFALCRTLANFSAIQGEETSITALH